MKKIVQYILGITFLLTYTSCSKEDAIEPTFEISVSANRVSVGDLVEVRINGQAETFSVFTGDAGREYIKSHLYVNAGKDTDYEDVWLPATAIDLVMLHLESPINSHNNNAQTDQTRAIIDPAVIRAGIQAIADVHFSNSELLRVKIFDVLVELTGVKSLSEEIVNLYSKNNNLVLTPEGGYSTGFTVDRIEKVFTYRYSAAGTYKLTVVGTNVGRKKYEGNGYNTDRTSNGGEYDYSRTIREVTITVE